jgi:hypothetical protein
VQHIARLLDGKEQGTRVDLAYRQQVEFEGGDDTEGTAAAAQRPEQIRFVVGIDADLLATRGDKLDCCHPIAGETVLASVETDAATKCVADYADAWRRAMEGAETLLRCPSNKITPESARVDPRSLDISIDLNAAETGGTQQDSVGKRAEGRRKMPGALSGDMLAIGRRRTDNSTHIVCTSWQRDASGLLINQKVEYPALHVPIGILRGEKLSRHD